MPVYTKNEVLMNDTLLRDVEMPATRPLHLTTRLGSAVMDRGRIGGIGGHHTRIRERDPGDDTQLHDVPISPGSLSTTSTILGRELGIAPPESGINPGYGEDHRKPHLRLVNIQLDVRSLLGLRGERRCITSGESPSRETNSRSMPQTSRSITMRQIMSKSLSEPTRGISPRWEPS